MKKKFLQNFKYCQLDVLAVGQSGNHYNISLIRYIYEDILLKLCFEEAHFQPKTLLITFLYPSKDLETEIYWD